MRNPWRGSGRGSEAFEEALVRNTEDMVVATAMGSHVFFLDRVERSHRSHTRCCTSSTCGCSGRWTGEADARAVDLVVAGIIRKIQGNE